MSQNPGILKQPYNYANYNALNASKLFFKLRREGKTKVARGMFSPSSETDDGAAEQSLANPTEERPHKNPANGAVKPIFKGELLPPDELSKRENIRVHVVGLIEVFDLGSMREFFSEKGQPKLEGKDLKDPAKVAANSKSKFFRNTGNKLCAKITAFSDFIDCKIKLNKTLSEFEAIFQT